MFELPDPDSPQTVADWVELELAGGEPSVSRSKLVSVVEADEDFVSGVWRELESRQARYAAPFFTVEATQVVRVSDTPAVPEYVACLLFSLYGVSEEHRTDPKLFERLTAEAIKNYLNGKVFVFGWPVLAGQNADIGSRVRDIAAATRERFAENPAHRYKDRGVDVIGWKPFKEHREDRHRTCQIILLSQCAAGANWRGKAGQLPFKSWTQYIHWACDPLTSFAVPRVIPEDLWHDVSRVAGILFDRIRLMNLLPNGVSDPALREALDIWIQQEIDEAKL